jgi:hypothetical protein
VITGGIVWTADTSGELAARDVRTGALLWHAALDVPVLAGLAVSGDALVVASYDGSVRLLGPTPRREIARAPTTCSTPASATGCCERSGTPTSTALLVFGVALAMHPGSRRRSTRIQA